MPKLKPKILDKEFLTKKEPEKSLLIPLKKTGGRGVDGRITVRGRGGGNKRKYRLIDFGQEKLVLRGKVVALEYDPNRTAFVALIEYENQQKGYLLAPHGLKIGDEIICQEKTEIKIGNRLKLKYIPLGTSVYNIELMPGKGGKIVRSAGTQAIIKGQEKEYTILQLPSGEIRKVKNECFASIGQVSHPGHEEEIVGKAGRLRWRGRRPKVRGSAMNPCDHPHGGGEGRQPIGLKYPKNIWGKQFKGIKTRKEKWTDALIIKKRK